ncbi:hypothetical protein ACWGF3_07970 [Streptomyces xanthophaeus]|uniref:Uncharacterized protein n=1 Tax=Streptomyces xanthophaeus TaxID=67385 RepID=A0A919GW10_9ACTN|nr:hypothetical protein [Streptomyces xanthophaeus]WST26161.1 hypothetical protein OG264_34465 [Streptomyces xanthophaeus]WST58863.1 hypothetical protein OG605_03970 [Streptomyces xanthophaeus]GHI85696.1 hypothetical protein Sxan_30600 [Streptomyces xanthophaeus]
MQETHFATEATAVPPRPLSALGAARVKSDSPIYDRLELEWLRAGRTVPRPVSPAGWRRVDDDDRFRRA